VQIVLSLLAVRSTETSVLGRGENVDSAVKTSELLAELQDSISIEGRSGSVRVFLQGVGFRGSSIKRGERNKHLIIDKQQFYIISI
jgi:hypothetical protein